MDISEYATTDEQVAHFLSRAIRRMQQCLGAEERGDTRACEHRDHARLDCLMVRHMLGLGTQH